MMMMMIGRKTNNNNNNNNNNYIVSNYYSTPTNTYTLYLLPDKASTTSNDRVFQFLTEFHESDRKANGSAHGTNESLAQFGVGHGRTLFRNRLLVSTY